MRDRPDALLARVSMLYYLGERTQAEVGERLRIPRSTVSRLLRLAREAGIVRVTVTPPNGVLTELESQLEAQFSLRSVRAVPVAFGCTCEGVRRAIGAAAAEDLARAVQSPGTIAVGEGRLVAAMADAVIPARPDDVRVAQAVGWSDRNATTPSPSTLVRRLADAFDCAAVQIPVPGVLPSRDVRRALEADDHLAAALRALDRVDSLWVEIAGADADARVVFGHEGRTALRRARAVGHLARRYFDERGAMVRTTLDDRVVGITPEQLQRVGQVVALAGPAARPEVIVAALRTGLVHALVTDAVTARAVLDRATRPVERFHRGVGARRAEAPGR